MKRLLLILVLFAVSGCAVTEFFPLREPNIRVTTDTFDGVIFTADNAAQNDISYMFNDPIVEYWTPSEKQVTEMEAALVPFLQETIASDEYGFGLWDDLPSYKRQYFGIAFEDGQRVIYANYFCASDYFDEWEDHFVMVMDGGDCFFQIQYDPSKGTFSHLQINGVA